MLARGPWPVAIENPADPTRPLRKVTLTNASLATSGLYRGRHIISPRTGRPSEATATLSAVIAPSALESDGWATALLASGWSEGQRLAERQNLSALLVDAEGHAKISSQGATKFISP